MRNNDFCELTLIRRDNRKLEVHKVILLAYINVFKNMIAGDKHPHPMIFLLIFEKEKNILKQKEYASFILLYLWEKYEPVCHGQSLLSKQWF